MKQDQKEEKKRFEKFMSKQKKPKHPALDPEAELLKSHQEAMTLESELDDMEKVVEMESTEESKPLPDGAQDLLSRLQDSDAEASSSRQPYDLDSEMKKVSTAPAALNSPATSDRVSTRSYPFSPGNDGSENLAGGMGRFRPAHRNSNNSVESGRQGLTSLPSVGSLPQGSENGSRRPSSENPQVEFEPVSLNVIPPKSPPAGGNAMADDVNINNGESASHSWLESDRSGSASSAAPSMPSLHHEVRPNQSENTNGQSPKVSVSTINKSSSNEQQNNSGSDNF